MWKQSQISLLVTQTMLTWTTSVLYKVQLIPCLIQLNGVTRLPRLSTIDYDMIMTQN